MISLTFTPSPVAPAFPALYRVKRDAEMSPPFERTWTQDSGHVAVMLPAVFPMRAENYNGVISDRNGEVRAHLSQAWLDCLAAQNSEWGARYLFFPTSGLFNGGVERGLEQLLMADHIVQINETRRSDGRNWGLVDTYRLSDAPPAAPVAHRKMRFTVIYRDGLTIAAETPREPVYSVLVSHVPVWFDMSKLTKI